LNNRQKDKSSNNKNEHKINEEIKAFKVRLIDENSNAQGVVDTKVALRQAREKNLDLVLVAENSDPPVCKIMNYGKVKYDKNKAEKKQKQQQQNDIKEMWLRPNTEDHDLETKMKQVRKFLEKGSKVIITIKFKGRELRLGSSSEVMIEKVQVHLEDVSEKIDVGSLEGRRLRVVVDPKKEK
jgi:translation initiation factor IF-3